MYLNEELIIMVRQMSSNSYRSTTNTTLIKLKSQCREWKKLKNLRQHLCDRGINSNQLIFIKPHNLIKASWIQLLRFRFWNKSNCQMVKISLHQNLPHIKKILNLHRPFLTIFLSKLVDITNIPTQWPFKLSQEQKIKLKILCNRQLNYHKNKNMSYLWHYQIFKLKIKKFWVQNKIYLRIWRKLKIWLNNLKIIQ